MSIPPDRVDSVRASIESQHRLGRRARLEAMESECHALKASVLEGGKRLAKEGASLMQQGARLAILEGKVAVMLGEIRSDETTLRLPVLPE